MTDIKMQSSMSLANGFPCFDIDHDASSSGWRIDGSRARLQRACMAALVQKGEIPQLPDEGIEWSRLLAPTRDETAASLSEISKQIADAISDAGVSEYIASFTKEGTQLTVSITNGGV